MIINCLNGYFKFEEQEVGEASQFMRFTGLELVDSRHGLTFKQLKDAESYSIKGVDYLGNIAKKTYEGSPWEVFRENKLAYNFNTGKIVEIDTINQVFGISLVGSYFVANGLIIPGSTNSKGEKVLSYRAHYSVGASRYYYSWVEYV